MTRLRLPRPLSTAVQFVLSLSISLGVTTIIVIVIFARETVPITSYGSAPQRAAVGPDAVALMGPILPATDSTLSPEDAGLLYRGLVPLTQPDGEGSAHPNDRPVTAFPVPWERLAEDSSVFADARSPGGRVPRIDRNKLFTSLARGLSSDERATVANIAGDTLWSAFDRVARAARLDVVTASFVLPLDPRRSASELPLPRTSRINALSDGVAYRVLHEVVNGRRDRAEAVIGAQYALGLRMSTDGVSAIEALLGQRLALDAIDLRRELHERLPQAGSATIVTASARIRQSVDSARAAREAPRDTAAAADLRDVTLTAVADTTLGRPFRLELLGFAGYTSCASPRELLFGPGPALVTARADALRTLAVSAADTAYLEYLDAQTMQARFTSSARGWFPSLIRRTAAGLSTVTTNARFRACADMLVAANFF